MTSTGHSDRLHKHPLHLAPYNKIGCYLNRKIWLIFKYLKLKTRKIGCYFIVIKIKEKRRCQFKNNISSYCRSSPSSGQDSNWFKICIKRKKKVSVQEQYLLLLQILPKFWSRFYLASKQRHNFFWGARCLLYCSTK
jgi:hypothetical protein